MAFRFPHLVTYLYIHITVGTFEVYSECTSQAKQSPLTMP